LEVKQDRVRRESPPALSINDRGPLNSPTQYSSVDS
jgi:hypothetical protein